MSASSSLEGTSKTSATTGATGIAGEAVLDADLPEILLSFLGGSAAVILGDRECSNSLRFISGVFGRVASDVYSGMRLRAALP
jgi:hypothetical protein